MNLRYHLFPALAVLAVTSCTTPAQMDSPYQGKTSQAQTQDVLYYDLNASVVGAANVMDSLKARGFSVKPKPTYHPGQLVCQFIHIEKPIPNLMTIELCHVDPSRPKDEKVGHEKPEDFWQEVKFRGEENLEAYFERKKSQWQELGPNFYHKNYDWAINSRDRLPGWNFAEFRNHPIPGTGIFLVERERDPKHPTPTVAERKEAFALRFHPNTVQLFLGSIIASSDPKEREILERISNATRRGDCSYFPDGTWIQWVKPDAPLAANFKDKRFPVRALVLGTQSMDHFTLAAKPEAVIDFNGRRAAQIRLTREAWDILAVEVKTVMDMEPPAGVCSAG